MSLQKLICTQCGSNELALFGKAAFKCESCGTILVDEKPSEPGEKTLKEIMQQKSKEKPFRSARIQHGIEDQPDFTKDTNDHYTEQGNQFIKLVFFAAIIGGLAMLVVWLLE